MDNTYIAMIKMNDQKLNEIFAKIRKAEEMIREGYDELRELKIVTIEKKKAASDN